MVVKKEPGSSGDARRAAASRGATLSGHAQPGRGSPERSKEAAGLVACAAAALAELRTFEGSSGTPRSVIATVALASRVEASSSGAQRGGGQATPI